MRLRQTPISLICVAFVLAYLTVGATSAAAATFSNTASIALNDPTSQSTGQNNAKANPYPSTIAVSGLTGTVNHVAVTLSNTTYSFSQDIDVLLVGPGGQKFIVVAALGPSSGSVAANNSTLTLSDSGTLPGATTPWGSGNTFKPVNFPSFNKVWVPPAPAAPYSDPGASGAGATFGSVFNGAAPNGTWSLYAITTAGGDGTGAIAGGWSLDITTANVAATTTSVTSNNNPSFTSAPSSSVILTATVHKTSDNSNVSEGTVAFTDGGAPIPGCGAVAVSAGQAACTTTFATEGTHAITATYGATANFGQSSGSLSQIVNNHTTVTGSNYCNAGPIALSDPPATLANATPYPSNLFVSGLSGTVNHVSVMLKGTSYSHSQDIDVLLVGPGGQTLILVANLGPDSGAASNSTLTLDDGGTLPVHTTPWGSASTFKPVNFGGLNEIWGPPAPAGPYGDPGTAGTGATLGTVFGGINGNGTWSLYVITTAAGDGTGAVAGGWCANITAAAVAGTTTSLVSNNAPSFTTAPGNSVNLTATVQKASDSSNVGEGTVAFKDGSTTIAGCGAVPVSAGQAVCTTTFATEGTHPITAQYSGTANFGPSNASLSQRVNNHTTVTGSSYCNTGSIALNNPATSQADGTPYPSNVFVTGVNGNLVHLTVTLKGVTYSHSQDIDALLVGPGGQTLILVAAAGPSSGGALSNVTLTLDDGAPSTLLSSVGWGAANASVTSKPVNYGGPNEVFDAPAPLGPLGNPGPTGGGTATLGSVFNGASPNGTWSLYLITTAAGDGPGATSGGWCLGVTGPSPPTLTKSFGAASIPVGGSTSLSFTVANPNASTSLSGVGFTDTLPAGLVVSSPSGLTGTCGGGAITAAAASGSVSLSGATLAASATCTFSVNVASSTVGNKVNTTSAVSSVEGGTGTAGTASVVVAAIPLVIAKSFGAPAIPVGGQTSLTFSVSPNAALNPTQTGVGFTDTLPAGLVVATPNGLSGACGGGTISATAGSGSVTLSGGMLAPGAGCSFSVTVTGTSAGVKNNSVTVSSNEAGTGNTAAASLTVLAPPSLTKAFGAASIPLGGSTSLSFTVSNQNATASLSGVGFTDPLPSGVVVASPNGLTGSCGGGSITATAGTGTVSLSSATLGASANCTFSVNVTGTLVGSVTNTTSAVSSVEGGSGAAASAPLVVVAPPQISKAFGAASIAVNGTTSLSFTVSNPNAVAQVTGVAFTDTLPAGLVVATPNGLSGSCGGGTITAVAGSNSVSLAGATLAGAASCTFSANVTATAGGLLNNSVTVTSANGGTGNTAVATLGSAMPPTIAKAFGAATIPLNGSTSLSFTISNPVGNVTLNGIGFADTLPGGMAVATPNGVTGSCAGGSITATAGASSVSLSGASLAAGVSCTLSVNVTGTSPGAKSNSVTVSSTEGGTGNTAMAALTVVAPPSLSKSFGAASVPVGGSTSLSFTVSNPNSTVSLSGVGFTDALPSGMVVATPNGLTGSCGGGSITATAGTGTVGLSGATLAASFNCTFSVNVRPTLAGGLTNTTSAVSSVEGGSGAAASAPLAVVAPPQISKTFGAVSIALNGTTSLSFTVSNPNPTPVLSGVAFTDTLPAGLVVSTPNGLSGSCGGGTITAVVGSGSVSLVGATLAGSASCTFSVNVTGTSPGAKNNSVTVTSTNGGTGNTAIASVTTATPPTIAKSFGAATIPQGGSTSLTLTIANPAGNSTLTGIAFTDALPAGLVVATPTGLTGSCGGGSIAATAGAGSVSLSGASLAAGVSCTLSVNVTGTSPGAKSNSVTVSSTEGGTGNTAMAALTVVAPPSLSKSFGAASVPVGGSTSLSFTLSDPNATVALSGVGFTDALPSGMVVATPNGLTGSCGGGSITATAGTGSVSLSGATLAASSGCTFSVNVRPTLAGGLSNTTSTVSSAEGGSGAAASAGLTVVAPPQITKAFGAATIALNGSTSLTFSISNPNATTALSGVAFTDALPAGLVVSTPNGLSGSCGGGTITAVAGSSSVSLAGAALAGAATCTFSVSVTATAAGVLNNSVTVSSTNGGTGNTAIATVTTATPPTIAKSFGAATIPLNGSTSVSFTISNPVGNVTLSGIGFTDALPAGLVVATPNGLTGPCGGGSITATAGAGSVSLSGASLAAGASCTFAVNVKGTAAGPASNSVTVSAQESGPGNTSTASLTVVAPPVIGKVFGAGAVPLGGSTSLAFTVSNPAGNVGLTGVAFSDALPAGLVVATPNALTGSCGGGSIIATSGSGVVSLGGAALATGASCSFSVNVTGTAAGDQHNSVTVGSTNGGQGNQATANVTVVGPPTIAKAFGAASIPFGTSTSLTFTISNPNTGAPLHGIGFTDSLPAGLVVASPTGVVGTCGGGTVAATAGGSTIGFTGGVLAAAANCAVAVNVTAVAVGVQNNTTSSVTSTEGGSGGPASASVTVGMAPTTTTVTANPTSAGFGSPVTFTAQVAPAQANGSGVGPTGTVKFFLDGGTTAVATAPLAAGGQASFTTSGLGAGRHTVVAVYGGDQAFKTSTSSPGATVNVTCGTTVSANVAGALIVGPGSTCIAAGVHIAGAVSVHAGSAVDIENARIDGAITATGPTAFRLCGSTTGGGVSVRDATGFVLIGDPGEDMCATNTIAGSLGLTNNTHGLVAIGNRVSGAVSASGNSGAGVFPDQTGAVISGNGP